MIATTTVVTDNFFQALMIMDNHYSKNQYMHEIVYATGANSAEDIAGEKISHPSMVST